MLPKWRLKCNARRERYLLTVFLKTCNKSQAPEGGGIFNGITKDTKMLNPAASDWSNRSEPESLVFFTAARGRLFWLRSFVSRLFIIAEGQKV